MLPDSDKIRQISNTIDMFNEDDDIQEMLRYWAENMDIFFRLFNDFERCVNIDKKGKYTCVDSESLSSLIDFVNGNGF